MRRTLGDLRDIFAQPAVLSRAQVLAAVGRHGLQIALDNEILVKISQGQYAPKAHAQAWWTGCAAAVATRGPGAAVGGRAALFLWRIDDKMPLTKLVVVGTNAGTPRNIEGVQLLRTRVDYQVYHVNGLPVVEPELALFQAMRGLTEQQARNLAIGALCSRRVRQMRVRELLERHTRLPGHGHVAAALALVESGVHSPLEFDASRAVMTGPLAKSFVRQYDIVAGASRFRADAFDRGAMLAVEFDGYAYHSDEPQMAADRERDVWFATIGIQTLRFMSSDVRRRPDWCRERITQVREVRLARFVSAL